MMRFPLFALILSCPLLMGVVSTTTIILTQDTSFHINCALGNDANDGTSPLLNQPFPVGPKKTLEGASTYMYSKIDVDGWSLFWEFAPGVCDETNGNGRGAIMAGLVKGQGVQRPGQSASEIRWRGDPNNWSAVRISTNAWPGPFFASTASAGWIEHMQLEARGANTHAIEARWYGLWFFNNVVFLNSSGAHRQSDTGGYIEARGVYAIAGNAQAHVSVHGNGIGYQKNIPVYIVPGLTGACPSFSTAFLSLSTGGKIQNYTSQWINGGCNASGQTINGTSTTEVIGYTNLPSGLSGSSIEPGMRLQ